MRNRLLILFPGFLLLVLFNSNAQCPVLQCPLQSQMVCDSSLNDTLFWNEPNYWDHFIGTHDLFETETDLELSVIDSCNVAGLQISYLLLLDLDGDGAQETAVWSDSLPPADTVYFDNVGNPGYSGGTALQFDKRNVAAHQKYGFALEQVAQGDTLTAKLRWNTAANPLIFNLPQLPGGTHKIRWFIESGAAHDTCEQTFTIKDCKKPTVNCLVGLSVNIMPTGMVQLWATDFLLSMEDNITPSNQLVLSVKKVATGCSVNVNDNPTPFVTFTCDDIGTNMIELWVKDKAGNTNFCETWMIETDNFSNCSGNPNSQYCLCAYTENNKAIEDISASLSGASNGIPSFLFTTQAPNNGCITFNGIPIGSSIVITPAKDDNPLNGVSTYDLVLMSKHILGQEALNSPYKMIAADANKSNSISTFDIIEIRKLVLGIYTELPANTSWRFVNKAFVFPNPLNPFQIAFPENVLQTTLQSNQPIDFIGIKVGDVNGTAIPNSFTNPAIDDRSAEHILLPDLDADAGQLLEIPITIPAANAWLGFQFSLQYDENQLNIESIESGDLPDLTDESFAQTAGEIRCSWSAGVAHTLLPGDRLFTLRARTLKPLHLRDAVSLTDKRLRSEAYTEGNQPIVPLQLAFGTISATNNQTAVFAPQPNPTNGGTKFSVQLMEDASVRLEIRDISGKLIHQSAPYLVAGRHLMDLPAEALPHAGCYFWTVKTGTIIQSGTLIRQ